MIDVAALQAMAGSGLTAQPIDRARAVMILRAARASDLGTEGLAIVLRARAEHRAWVTITQRQWQAKTRRPCRARHHDSIAIRERYVTGR